MQVGVDSENFGAAVNGAKSAVSGLEQLPAPNFSQNNLSRITNIGKIVSQFNNSIKNYIEVAEDDMQKMLQTSQGIKEQDHSLAGQIASNTVRFK